MATMIGAIIVAAGSLSAGTQLTGAGSTFDYPFFSRAFYDYSQQHDGVTVNYQSIGSGGGIQQFIAKTIDFGASDVPMNADELSHAGAPVLQIPVTLGGAAIAYNLAGIPSGLKLTRDSIAEIFLGNIVNWKDPAIQKLNPGLKLPDLPIVVVHRSDGSGTSYIFTDFLSAVSPKWKQKVGVGKSVQWPVGIGGKGNEGVAGLVGQTPGAIGYIELAYVLQNQITYALVENKAGAYVYPALATVKAAAASKPNVSATDFSIVDAAGADSYAISGYSWVMLYQNPSDPGRAAVIKALMNWLVTKGQATAEAVQYVPLPENVQQHAVQVLAQMKTG
ncbi:MAG: phosphate ABC transporter substrate-binding protein PstS [Candidatus Binataceae bacterium]